MPKNCAICQESGTKLKNIYKTRIGTPLIRVKELLLQVFEEEDELPNEIGKFGENQSSLCIDCENKLLEYYEAALRVSVKRKEFHDLVRPPNSLDIKSPDQEISIRSPIPWSDHDDDGLSEATMDDVDDVDWVMDVKDTKLLTSDDSNAEFPTEGACKPHIKKNHRKSSKHKCSTCGLTFTKICLLSVHEAKHLAQTCSYCSLSFSRKCDLRLHKETEHTDIKEFQCDACGNLYNTRRSLIKHKRGHSGIGKYACDECPKRFRESQDFNRHKLTHSGLKPHACPVCFRQFARIHNMYAHMKEHSKPGNLTKRPKCNSCGQFFTAQQFLNNHLEAGKCVMAYSKMPQHKNKTIKAACTADKEEPAWNNEMNKLTTNSFPCIELAEVAANFDLQKVFAEGLAPV